MLNSTTCVSGSFFGFIPNPDLTPEEAFGWDAGVETSILQGRATLDKFETASQRHAEIVECYLLAGPADYLLRVAYRDAADFERIHTKLLTQLPGVSRVQSALTPRTIKRTTAVPI